jgi:hypothetical protein
MYILEVNENPKYLKKPDYDYNYNYDVENVSDLTIHWDIIIDKP